jgi:protease-4
MRGFLKMLLAAFTWGLVLIAVLVLVLYFQFLRDVPDVVDDSFLVQELSGSIPEYSPGGLAGMTAGGPTHTEVLENLEKAAVDDRITGVILRIGSPRTGMGMTEEIRERIQELKEAGKPVYAYLNSLDNRNLLIATACDSVYQLPTGYVELTGLSMEAMFLRNSLAKLGVTPNIHKIEDYKTAAEIVQRTDFSKEAREEIERILRIRYDILTSTIASDRGLEEYRIEELHRKGLLTPYEIVEAGVIDALLYWDELEDRLKGDHDELRITKGCQYGKVERRSVGLGGDHSIAVIHGQGTIAGGENGVLPVLGLKMGADEIGRAIRSARDDDDIDAIILRLDTGGGEGTASDRIGRWIESASEEKPVIVSIADVAASGGYMIAYRADVIVALPTSIVGSIGSITGKFNMREMYNRLGMTKDHVVVGPNALLYSDYHDWTPAERQLVESEHWSGYVRWVGEIAKFRNMTVEEVEALGGGRVFTGEEALANGLVDVLGGLDEAIRVAKERVEIPADEDVTLVHYPKIRGTMEGLLGTDSRDVVSLALNELLTDARETTSYYGKLDWTVFVDW